MTTATLPEHQTLRTPGLAIPVDCDLSDDNQANYGDYVADAMAFEADVDALHEDRAALLANAYQTTLAKLLEKGRELSDRRDALEHTLMQLRWRCFDLVQAVLPDFRAAVDEATADYEEALDNEMSNLRLLGIDQAMPSYPTNARAAEMQLRKRAAESDGVASVFGALKLAKDNLRVLESRVGTAPRRTACKITWEGVIGMPAKIADLAGINADSIQEPIDGTCKFGYLLGQTGLEQAALTTEHVRTLNEICECLPATNSHSLQQVIRADLTRVRTLMANLPATTQIQQWLTATAGGPIHHPV